MRLLTLPAQELTMPPTERARALVFEDSRSHQLLQRVKQAAASDAAALISGETGTGKEILARHLHELGGRRGRPFLAVSCGALSPSLAESELFGHEQGAGVARLPRWPRDKGRSAVHEPPAEGSRAAAPRAPSTR
ncbi:sigma 54-interacting transcriptional regulator [Sorangium cellulosum]|nr:sigma 54-interacting transcriptional regulator [Sorangium cellulosum]